MFSIINLGEKLVNEETYSKLIEYLETKDRIKKWDQALLYFSSIYTIVASILNFLYIHNDLTKIILIILFVGTWLEPIYFGYYRGTLRKESPIEKLRGWYILLFNMIFFTYIILAAILIALLMILIGSLFNIPNYVFLFIFLITAAIIVWPVWPRIKKRILSIEDLHEKRETSLCKEKCECKKREE